MITRKISILSRFLTLSPEHRKTVIDYLTVYLRETGDKDRKAIVAETQRPPKATLTLVFVRQLMASDEDALDLIASLLCPHCYEATCTVEKAKELVRDAYREVESYREAYSNRH